jgi:hypothetical protein
MSEPLEELRAQRELIQKHLDWLDEQIANTQASVVADDRPPPTEFRAELETASDETSASNPILPESTPPSAQSISPPPAIDSLFEAELKTGMSDVRRAQLGCFLFFTGGILLFLFLLFGLPYLVD